MQTFKIGSMNKFPDLKWSEGLEISLPSKFSDFLKKFNGANTVDELRLSIDIRSDELSRLAEFAKDELRIHRAFTYNKPLSSRLFFSYHIIPSRVRNVVGCFLGRSKRSKMKDWAVFPKWPLDLSVDFIEDLSKKPPSFSPTPVLLTHDIDSPEGIVNLYNYFLNIEEEFGARSANYVVPCAWPIDHSILEKVHKRGNEIGVHGYDHSNKTPFLDPLSRRKRLLAAESFIKRYNIVGYRAPSLVRTKELLNDLSEFYSYDSSIPTSGGMFPVPNNGCATARPFQICGLLEIPLSLPRDGSLRFLGYTPQEILNTWIMCAETISRSGGIISLLTHCEKNFSGNPEMLNTYKKFLSYIAENKKKFKFMLPRNISGLFHDKLSI